MILRWITSLVILLVSMPMSTKAQAVPSSRSIQRGIPPRLLGTVVTNQPLPGITVGQPVCSSSGTIYFRPYPDFRTEILGFDAGGHALPPINFIKTLDSGSEIRDITTLGDKLFVLLNDSSNTRPGVRIYSGQDAELAAIDLSSPPGNRRFMPVRIVAFNSGRILIVGSRSNRTDSQPLPFGAIFDPKGMFISYLRSGVNSGSSAAFKFGTGDIKETGRLVLTAITSDGTLAYLVTRDHRIVEFNDSGMEVAEIPIGDPGEGYIPTEAYVENGTLSVLYANTAGVDLLARFNPLTGSGMVVWDHSQFETKGLLGCVANNGDIIIRTGNELRRYETQ